MLVALLAALPDKDRAAILEQRHAGIFLVPRAGDIHAKRAERAGQGAIQPLRADAPAVAIGGIVLPDDQAVGRGNGGVGKDLIAQQLADDGIFGAVGGVIIGLGRAANGGRSCQNQRPSQGHGNTSGANRQ